MIIEVILSAVIIAFLLGGSFYKISFKRFHMLLIPIISAILYLFMQCPPFDDLFHTVTGGSEGFYISMCCIRTLGLILFCLMNLRFRPTFFLALGSLLDLLGKFRVPYLNKFLECSGIFEYVLSIGDIFMLLGLMALIIKVMCEKKTKVKFYTPEKEEKSKD